ncbi:uncharacterized protein DC041_0012882 [Schistosoma bovis]|uniref:Cleft lip and palate transmembrane protein 1 n=2 Tax=Schistosoma TaxID=6181 RepID=A0A430QN20_SCHBO|nr:uncharacterized protein DC041_0012882 [Schistosoma bovis]
MPTVSTTGTPAVQQQQAQPNKWGMLKAFAFRLLTAYFVLNLFRRPSPNQMDPSKTVIPATNLYQSGSMMDLFVYLSEDPTFHSFNNSNALFWYEPNITYGDWNGGPGGDGSYSKISEIQCSQFPNLMSNGSLYIHVYFVKPGFSPDPNTGNNYSLKYTVYKSKMLTRYKRRRLSRTTNLITGHTDSHPDLVADSSTPSDVQYLPPITHWHPNLTINLVDDHSPWVKGSVPVPLDQFIEFYSPTNEYYPVVYLNDYWNLNEDYKPVNETTPILPIHITLAPLSLFKWQLYAAQTAKKTWFNQIMATSMLPSENENDEEQDTIKLDYDSLVFNVFPRIHVDYQSSYVESDTKKYDQMAFRYLSWILFPLLAAYCGYSLIYEEHRGWYSWILSVSYGFLLTFGFIMMTPQLFINYKMKSVAHLPWRMLTYKALNTFIDDLFAFVIRMPTLYRIGCLRDDVIFFIYLYQRWIYPMDPNRINEFGVSKEMLDAHIKCEPKQSDIDSETTPALSSTSSDPNPTLSDSDDQSDVTSSVRKRKSGSLKK